MKGVIIGVDPHKLSATIEVVDSAERLLGTGRFSTDNAGYAALRRYVRQWPDRVWTVEGANGAGRPLAQRLVEAGEQVLDVPAKLAARVRLFDTGHNRKTDALDAHSIAIVAVRTPGLRVLAADGELEALRMLTDRRDELAHQRVQTVNRLQRLLSELIRSSDSVLWSPPPAVAEYPSCGPSRAIGGRIRFEPWAYTRAKRRGSVVSCALWVEPGGWVLGSDATPLGNDPRRTRSSRRAAFSTNLRMFTAANSRLMPSSTTCNRCPAGSIASTNGWDRSMRRRRNLGPPVC